MEPVAELVSEASEHLARSSLLHPDADEGDDVARMPLQPDQLLGGPHVDRALVGELVGHAIPEGVRELILDPIHISVIEPEVHETLEGSGQLHRGRHGAFRLGHILELPEWEPTLDEGQYLLPAAADRPDLLLMDRKNILVGGGTEMEVCDLANTGTSARP